MKRHLAAAAFTAVAASCGGVVVFDEAGSGGAGSSGRSAASAGEATSSSPVTGCADTRDCADGEVCVLATNECRPACAFPACDACGPGLVCEPCATSSCPGCKDCVAACTPPSEGRCDHDDGCPPGEACDFGLLLCAETCSDGSTDTCSQGTCSPCRTGSCCGCRDCVDLCAPP